MLCCLMEGGVLLGHSDWHAAAGSTRPQQQQAAHGHCSSRQPRPQQQQAAHDHSSSRQHEATAAAGSTGCKFYEGCLAQRMTDLL